VEGVAAGTEAEVKKGTDIPVGAHLWGFKSFWTRDAWALKTVSKGLAWK